MAPVPKLINYHSSSNISYDRSIAAAAGGGLLTTNRNTSRFFDRMVQCGIFSVGGKVLEKVKRGE